MPWIVTFDGVQLDADDMTVEELGEVERISGVPWSIANPLREVKVAKAYIAVALLRTGRDKSEVASRLAALRQRDLKGVFDWREDDQEGQGEQEELDPSDPPPAPTSASSSPSEPPVAGRRAKHAKNDLGTSSSSSEKRPGRGDSVGVLTSS
jgi:hypothetical protein